MAKSIEVSPKTTADIKEIQRDALFDGNRHYSWVITENNVARVPSDRIPKKSKPEQLELVTTYRRILSGPLADWQEGLQSVHYKVVKKQTSSI